MSKQKETELDKLRRKTCRACSNGWGEGICSYHEHKFRVLGKQIQAHTRKTGGRA